MTRNPVRIEVKTVRSASGEPLGFLGSLVTETGNMVAATGVVRTAGLAAADARLDAQSLAVRLGLVVVS